MWNWQLSHDWWWEVLPKDDILPGQHVRTCLHPPKIMHAKVGQIFTSGFYSHRCVQRARIANLASTVNLLGMPYGQSDAC